MPDTYNFTHPFYEELFKLSIMNGKGKRFCSAKVQESLTKLINYAEELDDIYYWQIIDTVIATW